MSEKKVAEKEKDLRFPELRAREVAFIRALEEADRAGDLLPRAERQQASVDAFKNHGKKGEAVWIGRRARWLVARLERELPQLPRYLRSTRPGRGLALAVALAALILGLATNALGPERRINVLALPLFGLILWNLLMLALLLGQRLLPTARAFDRPVLARFFESWVQRLAGRLSGRWAKRHRGSGELWGQVFERDLAIWLPATAPLLVARARRLMHLGALVLVVGAVAGMYLRGVTFAYSATWESTFLSPEIVDPFLRAILTPASWISGLGVPSAAQIEAPMAGPAARWIHLWALTAALFVGIPRLALIAFESLRSAGLARRLGVPLPDAYRRRLRAAAETSVEGVSIVPYSYQPSPAATEALRGLLLDLVGVRAEVRQAPVVPYGGEVPEAPDEIAGRAVVFSLAQTPELEVHGEFLGELRRELPEGDALLVVVDGSPYRKRLGESETTERRLAERRRAWDRVVSEQGLEAAHLELEAEMAEDVLARLAAAAWPQGALGGE